MLTVLMDNFNFLTIMYACQMGIKKELRANYKISNNSIRVVKLITGTAKLNNMCNGIEKTKKSQSFKNENLQ